MASIEVEAVSDIALVASTSLGTGRFVPTERAVDRNAVAVLIDHLSSADQGYIEVRRHGADFPALLVGFRFGLAVVHCMSAPESMLLLAGDGSVPGSDLVEVLIMDDLASFTGEYVMESGRARDVVLRFLKGDDLSSLGDWDEL